METIKDRISEVSACLQRLMDPRIFPLVEKAVRDENKDLLIRACRKVRIPAEYISVIAPLLFRINQPKWPIDW